MSPILEVSNVSVHFEGLRALIDASFAIERGELFALIGPNGAGKTTLLNAISGIYAPQPGGSVTYTNRVGQRTELTTHRPHQIARLGIGRTFQNLGLFPSLSVLDNLMLGRYSHGKGNVLHGGLFTRRARNDELEARERVESIIELLGLAQYRREPVGGLPYGVQKRIELGRVLAMEPDLLMLDEPMAGMTVDEKRDMVRYIYDIRDAVACTILLIEHDMGVVMAIAERVMVLNFGETISIGSTDEVQRDDHVVAAYLGTAS